MKKKIIILIVIALYFSIGGKAQVKEILTSPDGRNTFTFTQENVSEGIKHMFYEVKRDGNIVVGKSRLGVQVENKLLESALAVPNENLENWCDNFTLIDVKRNEVNQIWQPPYGEWSSIRNNFKEMLIRFIKGKEEHGDYVQSKCYYLTLRVRIYDEGVAFRYEFPETTNGLFIHLTDELTEFRLPAGSTAICNEWAQSHFTWRSLDEAWDCEAERPLTIMTPHGTAVSLLEAQCVDYTRTKFQLKGKGVVKAQPYSCVDFMTPYSTSWRTIMLADKTIDLCNHDYMVLNLNDELADLNRKGLYSDSLTSVRKQWTWLKPGKVFRAGLNMKELMEVVDFCAEHNLQYCHLDARWYGSEMRMESSALTVDPSKDFTIPEICKYARSKGVGIILYVNQRALYKELDEILNQFEKWGVAGIKFGFVQVGNQMWTSWLHDAIRKCAEHHLLVDIHDEYRPTGYSRTYPNLMTVEGLAGNETMPDARHNVTLPFTRYLCGPADYTLCYYDNRVKCTKAHQLAMAVVYYSPLTWMFWYDNVHAYHGEPEIEFWEQVPTVWNSSKVLEGEPGEYIMTARQAHDGRWFVGAMNGTNRERTLTLKLTDLPGFNAKGKGAKYEVTTYIDDPSIVEDVAEDHVRASKRTKVRCVKQEATEKTVISLSMLKSGGAAVMVTPLQSQSPVLSNVRGSLKGNKHDKGRKKATKIALSQSVVFDYYTGDEGARAYIRLPRTSQHRSSQVKGKHALEYKPVRAILYTHQNMTEEVLFRSRLFTDRMDSMGVAMAFVQRGSQNWDVTQPCGVGPNKDASCQQRFEQILYDWAEGTGHHEILDAKIIPWGHSAQATFPWNFAAWNNDRTLCVISFHGDAPRTNLCGYGRANVEWGRTRNIDFIPSLMIEGEYEWWEARVLPALGFQMHYPNSRISMLCDAGKGHFDLCDNTLLYMARFIEKALADPRPQGGVRYSKFYEDGHVSRNFNEQFWYQDEEMRDWTRERYEQTRGKMPQYVSAKMNGELLKYDSTQHVRIRTSCHAKEFTLEPIFVNYEHNALSDKHANTTPRCVLISGPAIQIGPNHFKFDPDYFGKDNKRQWGGITLCVEADGDERYKSAVREISIVVEE